MIAGARDTPMLAYNSTWYFPSAAKLGTMYVYFLCYFPTIYIPNIPNFYTAKTTFWAQFLQALPFLKTICTHLLHQHLASLTHTPRLAILTTSSFRSYVLEVDFTLGRRLEITQWKQEKIKAHAETGFLTFFPVATRHSSSQCTRVISPLITEKPDRDITHPENDSTQ